MTAQKINHNLLEVFEQINSGQEHTVVVIPSISLPTHLLNNIYGIFYYEQRSLWEILRAITPTTNIIFVTSRSIPECAKNHLLGAYEKQIHSRVQFLTTNGHPQEGHLTGQILSNPQLIKKIKSMIKTPYAYLTSFLCGEEETLLSEKLEIPLFGLSAQLQYLHTKSGNHEIFDLAQIPCAKHRIHLHTFDQLIDAVIDLWQACPQAQKFMVKLNHGVSGDGNALINLSMTYSEFAKLSPTQKRNIISDELHQLQFQSDKMSWSEFCLQIKDGVVVEQFLEGQFKNSPSAQALILPSGEIEFLSTHEQLLDPSGMRFLGCQFPCRGEYRELIQEQTIKIGKQLFQYGVVGPFGVDYLALDDQQVYAIEINIRQGGTTHPLQTVKRLTQSQFDWESGHLIDLNHKKLSYMAFDNIYLPQMIGRDPQILIDKLHDLQLNFDPQKNRGVIFHMLGALNEMGKFGFTAMAQHLWEAELLAEQVKDMLEQFRLIQHQGQQLA